MSPWSWGPSEKTTAQCVGKRSKRRYSERPISMHGFRLNDLGSGKGMSMINNVKRAVLPSKGRFSPLWNVFGLNPINQIPRASWSDALNSITSCFCRLPGHRKYTLLGSPNKTVIKTPPVLLPSPSPPLCLFASLSASPSHTLPLALSPPLPFSPSPSPSLSLSLPLPHCPSAALPLALWLRTNGVNTNGAAAKVMIFDRLGEKGTPWHFCEDKLR